MATTTSTIEGLLHPFSYPYENTNAEVEIGEWMARATALKKEKLDSTAIGHVRKRDGGDEDDVECVEPRSLLFNDKLTRRCSCVLDSAQALDETETPRQLHQHEASDTPVDESTPTVAEMQQEDVAQDAVMLPSICYKVSPDARFENEALTISRSGIAGWGAFARRHLRRGEVILRERPLFVAKPETLFHVFRSLDKGAKSVAMSLHANEGYKVGTPRLQAVWWTNCFATGHDAVAGLFPVAARFNHACHPKRNIGYRFDAADKVLELSVLADFVPRGEELTISYGSGRTPADLYLWYGFRCRCGACKGLDEKEADALMNQW